MAYCNRDWSGKRDSNSRPRPWQGRALPTELFRIIVVFHCAAALTARTQLKSLILMHYFYCTFWSGKRDSNSRPRPWQGRALPTELFPHHCLSICYGVDCLSATELPDSEHLLLLLLRTCCKFFTGTGAHYTRNPSRRKRCKAKFCALRAFAVLIGKLLLSCAPALIYSCRKCSR